jgi:hypothetical protein
MTVTSAAAIRLLDSLDLELLSTRECSVLLEGPATATEAVLRLLHSHLGEPVEWHQPPAPLALPRSETRTLILRNACALTGDAQRGLLAWLGDAAPAPRIISTTARPLFPLVAEGLFDAVLYYRMNVLMLRVGTGSTGVPMSQVVHDHHDVCRVTTE